jgi:hypothetical protein
MACTSEKVDDFFSGKIQESSGSTLNIFSYIIKAGTRTRVITLANMSPYRMPGQGGHHVVFVSKAIDTWEQPQNSGPGGSMTGRSLSIDPLMMASFNSLPSFLRCF